MSPKIDYSFKILTICKNNSASLVYTPNYNLIKLLVIPKKIHSPF